MYKPSKKELKQLENINTGYNQIKEGLKLIKNNIPKKDGDIEMQTYKMSKNFDKIIKRIHTILEKQYVDKQFLDIVSFKPPTDKGKGGRFKKGKSSKKRTKRKKPKG